MQARTMERIEMELDVSTLREIDAEAEAKGVPRAEIIAEIFRAWDASAGEDDALSPRGT